MRLKDLSLLLKIHLEESCLNHDEAVDGLKNSDYIWYAYSQNNWVVTLKGKKVLDDILMSDHFKENTLWDLFEKLTEGEKERFMRIYNSMRKIEEKDLTMFIDLIKRTLVKDGRI